MPEILSPAEVSVLRDDAMTCTTPVSGSGSPYSISTFAPNLESKPATALSTWSETIFSILDVSPANNPSTVSFASVSLPLYASAFCVRLCIPPFTCPATCPASVSPALLKLLTALFAASFNPFVEIEFAVCSTDFFNFSAFVGRFAAACASRRCACICSNFFWLTLTMLPSSLTISGIIQTPHQMLFAQSDRTRLLDFADSNSVEQHTHL